MAGNVLLHFWVFPHDLITYLQHARGAIAISKFGSSLAGCALEGEVLITETPKLLKLRGGDVGQGCVTVVDGLRSCGIGSTVVVGVGGEEVRDTVSVEVPIDDLCECLQPRVLKSVEGDVVEAIHVFRVVLWVPSLPVVP